MAVQDAVDRLASRLGLSVLIEDVRQRPVWWCTVGAVDDVRARTILDRHVDRDAAKVVAEFGLRAVTGPVRTPPMPERGMWARWAVPVRHGEQPLGLLWILDPDTTVDEAGLAAAVEVAELAAAEMARTSRRADERGTARDALLARLLRGPDLDAAAELAELESLPPQPLVQVDAPARPGDWALPRSMSARVHRGRSRVATSGSPVPLVDLAEAARRAHVTRRALAAGATPRSRSYDALGAWLLVVEAPDSLSPAAVHPALDVLTAEPHADLLDTARAVTELGGDVAAAADQLHVHRTTLYYRLDRIVQLAGVDLRQGTARTDLQLALRLHAYRSLPA